MKKRPLLVVEWDDITTDNGWKSEDKDYADLIVHCYSVGWKLKSNRRNLVISNMRSDDGGCDKREIIPRGCIRSIRRLE